MFYKCINAIKITILYNKKGFIIQNNKKNLDILKQKPFAVDINSRYEISPGIKDLQKIKRTHEKL